MQMGIITWWNKLLHKLGVTSFQYFLLGSRNISSRALSTPGGAFGATLSFKSCFLSLPNILYFSGLVPILCGISKQIKGGKYIYKLDVDRWVADNVGWKHGGEWHNDNNDVYVPFTTLFDRISAEYDRGASLMIGSPSPSLGVGSPRIGFRDLVISFILSLNCFAYFFSWLSNSSRAFASAALKQTCPLLGTGFPDGDNAFSFGGIFPLYDQPVILPCCSFVWQEYQPDEGRESNKRNSPKQSWYLASVCWTFGRLSSQCHCSSLLHSQTSAPHISPGIWNLFLLRIHIYYHYYSLLDYIQYSHHVEIYLVSEGGGGGR